MPCATRNHAARRTSHHFCAFVVCIVGSGASAERGPARSGQCVHVSVGGRDQGRLAPPSPRPPRPLARLAPPPPSSPLLPPSLRARSVVDESSLVFSRLVCERPRCLKLCCARHGCGLLHWRERCRLLYVRWVGRCWRQVVDLLKEAMGNRSYGRGADPYCGGVDFEDEWFSRPLLRPCHVNLSLASPCLVFLVPAPDLVPSPC
jgi:hypothetical protein